MEFISGLPDCRITYLKLEHLTVCNNDGRAICYVDWWHHYNGISGGGKIGVDVDDGGEFEINRAKIMKIEN